LQGVSCPTLQKVSIGNQIRLAGVPLDWDIGDVQHEVVDGGGRRLMLLWSDRLRFLVEIV